MYGTRNVKKRTVMQDMSNLTSNVANSDKNSKVLQKIHLVEVTQSLRPRRGDKNNVAEKCFTEKLCKGKKCIENNCKENNVPQIKLMQDMSNFKCNQASSIEHNEVPQKIPLTEVTKTLRPRRGCKSNSAENNCKENKIPHSKPAVNKQKCTKTDTSLTLKSVTNTPHKKSTTQKSEIKKTDEIVIQKSGGDVSRALLISEKDPKSKTTSKSRILQSIQNFNLKNNKSDSEPKVMNKRKAPLKQKGESREKKRKIETAGKISKDSRIMRKFPKWLSNGVESLRPGKKRVCNSNDVYDIETDKDLMFEKPVVKKVVKRAKITKTKNYPCKHDYHTMRGKNSLTQLNKNCRAKEVVMKYPEKPCAKFENSILEASDNLEPKKVSEVSKGVVNLHSNKSSTVVKESAAPNTEEPKSKDVNNLNIPNTQHNVAVEKTTTNNIENNIEHEKVQKLTERLKTPEKFPLQKGVSSLMEDIENSFNFQLFPMPQASSTPQNADKPNMAAQMLCSGFGATLLEIPQSQEVQVHVSSDTEFLSMEEIVPDRNEIQLFESSPPGQREQTVKGDLHKMHSAVKNLNASLNVVVAEHVTTRPRRACHQNKPDTNEASDIESSPEDFNEITLFESPEKKSPEKEEVPKCSPSKAILKKLFPEEFDVSPLKVVNVEEKVLKPRKSYHSPAQFRRHIMKAKKENKVPKKTKTKQEKLMEDLNNHFLELENMELCIE